MWSPTIANDRHVIKATAAVSEFRTQMLMPPLQKVPGYVTWEKNSKKKETNLTEKDRKDIATFRFQSCAGQYQSIYLDEVHRKNDNPISNRWKYEILPAMRYGKVTAEHIAFMKKHSAKVFHLSESPEWDDRYILQAFHYHNSLYPNRSSVESANYRGLLEYHKTTDLLLYDLMHVNFHRQNVAN